MAEAAAAAAHVTGGDVDDSALRREWRAAMAANMSIEAAEAVSPSGAISSVELCSLALEIAANPGRYGVHPQDALQACRMYYAK